MECRSSCGACCIAPSIASPYFAMPKGKPAGVACVHLDLDNRTCAIWGSEHYPNTCKFFTPHRDFCGDSREEAIRILQHMEQTTNPIQN